MQHLPKLMGNCIRRVINPTLRNESIFVKARDQKDTESSYLDAKEEGCFWKKNREYLQHIEDELRSGKNIKDILEEHKKRMQQAYQNRVYQNQTVQWATAEEDESSDDMIKSQENAEEDMNYNQENTDKKLNNTFVEDIWEKTKQKWLEIKNTLWK